MEPVGHRPPPPLGRIIVVPARRAFRPREKRRSVVRAGRGRPHLEDPRRRMPCAVRLALAILQEQGDQPVAVVLAYAAADDDVRLVGIGGLRGEQSFREPQAHGSTCCTRRHSRLPSVSSRVGGVELVRLQHLAPACEATQRVAVDEVLGGELLVVTAERAVQVGQREPLQLVATLLFPGTSSTDCSLTRRTVAARSDTTRRVRLSGTLSHLRGDSGRHRPSASAASRTVTSSLPASSTDAATAITSWPLSRRASASAGGYISSSRRRAVTRRDQFRAADPVRPATRLRLPERSAGSPRSRRVVLHPLLPEPARRVPSPRVRPGP